ncbi:hotdog fold thioesterase [Rhodococcus sp. GXMU-t2271]|uniref:PaaI family thioesterase n=1 Tax=Rhodococcus sp. GXMU-t2271 TaxID=3059079 RepID=UPI00352BB70C
MTVTAPETDRLNAFMGIDTVAGKPGTVSFRQPLGARFLDHRGRTTVGSVGVLTDVVLGAAPHLVWRGQGRDTRSVLTQLSASTANPMPTRGDLHGTGRAVHVDDSTALSTAQICDDAGDLVVQLTGRSMVVDRPAVFDSFADASGLARPTPEPWTDPSELADRTGLDTVFGIAAGTVARGPLAGLLDLRVGAVEKGRVAAVVLPAEWMANPMGTVQGGVLVSVAGTVAELAAQTLTAAGQEYRLLNLTLDYLRSPAAPGPDLLVDARVTRAGRRLASIDTHLTAPDGTVLVRAQASVQLLAS